MEFNEKLKELRSSRGLTQEELAEALFVSRTAVSKWESGRGYPSIDSLKEISTFFSVTIDELLSGEKLVSIAKKENKSNIQSLCSILIGFIDLFHFLLIVLPLYPNSMKGYIASVNLLSYTETSVFNRMVYWGLFFLLMGTGVAEVIVTQLKIEKVYKMVIVFSMLLGIVAVLFLALTGETYATALAFLLLVVKAGLYIKGR
ncbi:helix-turn-helix domain-containing protein [Absicoccus porci]|uniref:helix-turn-helix domain-containing protein n=1 Tax=Absicoccus porci TaxID=2486576 RepID=UPI001568E14B|nr:helix-turn-helix transcriptional regulator [Absicoccus porci]MEE1354909.1 helix-turn-helix transcriptional regulator [Absicoccus porci]